ncbi:hypothetical protein Ddc_04271 [Ditylenchus destructor]|nr:hypothetical protein Ddc_04271 [Ditylenchus destructor]
MIRKICIACGLVIVLSFINEITTAPSGYGSEPAPPPPAASYGGSAPVASPPAPQPSSDCDVSGDAYSGGGESGATGGGSNGKAGPSYGSSPGLRKGCVHVATYDGLGGAR